MANWFSRLLGRKDRQELPRRDYHDLLYNMQYNPNGNLEDDPADLDDDQ